MQGWGSLKVHGSIFTADVPILYREVIKDNLQGGKKSRKKITEWATFSKVKIKILTALNSNNVISLETSRNIPFQCYHQLEREPYVVNVKQT